MLTLLVCYSLNHMCVENTQTNPTPSYPPPPLNFFSCKIGFNSSISFGLIWTPPPPPQKINHKFDFIKQNDFFGGMKICCSPMKEDLGGICVWYIFGDNSGLMGWMVGTWLDVQPSRHSNHHLPLSLLS